MTEPKEGTVRWPPKLGGGHLVDTFSLEIYFRGKWVMFGSFGVIATNDLEWQTAYRKKCDEVVDRFLEGQS